MTTIPASHRDLLDAEVATLATLGDNGWPQLSELWFLAEDETVRLSLNTTRQKVKNLRRRPTCSLLILDLANPHRYLEIRGDAESSPTSITPSPTSSQSNTGRTCGTWTARVSRAWS